MAFTKAHLNLRSLEIPRNEVRTIAVKVVGVNGVNLDLHQADHNSQEWPHLLV